MKYRIIKVPAGYIIEYKNFFKWNEFCSHYGGLRTYDTVKESEKACILHYNRQRFTKHEVVKELELK